MSGHHFICYSPADAEEFALRLYDALTADRLPAWLDKRKLRPGEDWGQQIVEALRRCGSVLFVMTRDSVEPQSVCQQEWTRALKYKKPVIPLRLHHDAETPFRLGERQEIDFTGDFETGLAKLRQHLAWLGSTEGKLGQLKDRLADAHRAFRRTDDPQEKRRINDDIADLDKEIARLEETNRDPAGVARRRKERIEAAIERERKPAKPVSGESHTRFINPPPGAAPPHFCGREQETRLIGEFLKDPSQRLLTVVGRGGMGKTSLVCRVLKMVENGRLPDDEPFTVGGIVYLSKLGSRRVTFENLFFDLLKLLPGEESRHLENLYKQPQVSTAIKTRAVLEACSQLPVVVLLDSFEDVMDQETRGVADEQLREALEELLNAAEHTVKAIITTRVPPRALAFLKPARQCRIDLDEGLTLTQAVEMLQQMDREKAGGKLGLADGKEALLAEAQRRTAGNPRALEALFAILSADRDSTLANILDESAALLPETVTSALVGEAFSRLDETAQRVLQALAIYGRPVSPAAVDYLLQPFQEDIDAAPVLSWLTNAYFAQHDEGKYHLHAVDQEYALSLIARGESSDRAKARFAAFWDDATEEQKERVRRENENHSFVQTPPDCPYTQIALHHRGATFFVHTRKPRREWKTMQDIQSQLDEFELRCAGGDWNAAADVLKSISFNYLLLWGDASRAVELHKRLIGNLDDANRENQNLNCLGLAYLDLGKIKEAIKCFTATLESARKNNLRSREAVSIGNLGLCHRALGDASQTMEYHKQALSIIREIGNRRAEGVQLGNLGLCYAGIGDSHRAIELYKEALAIAREINDRRGEASVLGKLGNRYAALGETQLAIEHLQQALDMAREIRDRAGESSVLIGLGNCHSALGETSCAIEQIEQGLAIAREIGNPRGEASALVGLGNCNAMLGDIHCATKNFEQALAIVREIGNLRGEARVLLGLANALIQTGDFDEVLRASQKGVQLGETVKSPATYCAHYGAISLVLLYRNELKEARDAAELTLGYDVPRFNQFKYALLGLISLRQGDGIAARKAFDCAMEHSEMMISRCHKSFGPGIPKDWRWRGWRCVAKKKRIQKMTRVSITSTRLPRLLARVRQWILMIFWPQPSRRFGWLGGLTGMRGT